ncbi:MAG: hypothetical protein ACR2K5_14570 [Pseudolabrys sp.]
MNEQRIDQLLAEYFARQPKDAAAAARVLRRLAQPLPRQTVGVWARLPSVLLDWQFAPAWPRLAALSACAALGFFIGLAGFDARIDDASARYSLASTDLSSVFYDSEPLTGARP